MPLLLGIDVGTSGTKALLLDPKGKVLATATAEHVLLSPKTGWYEQRPLDWWSGVCEATQAVLKKAKLKGTEIGAIGLSGQMHGAVFLDAKGRVLRPAILWNDQRTTEECAEIEAAVGGREALVKLVANPALPGFTAPKILWLRKNEPKRYELTKMVVLPKDFIRFQMTGEFATDASDASGTLLLDVAKRDWCGELLTKLRIDRSMLPKVFESTEITGTLNKEAAASMGLVAGIPVVAGAGDNAAAAVGNGVVRAGMLASSIGTSGVIYAHSDHVSVDPLGRVHTMCSAVPGRWSVFGCMLSAGGSLQWFRDVLGQDDVAAAKKQKVDPYQLLLAAAEGAPLGSEGLYFLPYLTGERTPHNDAAARGAYIGLTRRTTKGMMVRSLVEGVTYGLRDQIEIMRSLNVPIESVRATGGGSRSLLWLQLQADILRTPVVMTNSVEGPTFGAALLAGVGTKVWATVEQACEATVAETSRIKTRGKEAKVYDRHYEVYKSLYPTLKPVFPKLSPVAE